MDVAPELVRVLLLGRSHAVSAPPSIIEQEEVYLAWQEASSNPRGGLRILRAAAALVGLCTRIGRESGITYASAGCDPLVYGGRVYDWLRAQPKGTEGLAAAAVAIQPVLVSSLHAIQQAQAQADFSGPRGVA